MNCPRCNGVNLEGKAYCGDCGSPLTASLAYLETKVSERVAQEISDRFKDQRLVALEVSDAILTRLMAWAKIYAFIVGGLVALFLAVLAVLGISTYRDVARLVREAQSTVQPKLVLARDEAEKAQRLAGEAIQSSQDALGTIEAARKKVDAQVRIAADTAVRVKVLSEQVSDLQKRTSKDITKANRQVETDVADLSKKVGAALQDISEQQKKLASTDELVKALFSKGVTEYFDTTGQASNVVIVPLKKGAMVWMLLGSAPIYQTIEVKWRVFSQPRGAYATMNNVLFFSWGDSADSLKQYPLEITYVPDPTSKVVAFKSLSKRNGTLFADNTKIADLPPPQ
jgi:hypothetical protein